MAQSELTRKALAEMLSRGNREQLLRNKDMFIGELRKRYRPEMRRDCILLERAVNVGLGVAIANKLQRGIPQEQEIARLAQQLQSRANMSEQEAKDVISLFADALGWPKPGQSTKQNSRPWMLANNQVSDPWNSKAPAQPVPRGQNSAKNRAPLVIFAIIVVAVITFFVMRGGGVGGNRMNGTWEWVPYDKLLQNWDQMRITAFNGSKGNIQYAQFGGPSYQMTPWYTGTIEISGDRMTIRIQGASNETGTFKWISSDCFEFKTNGETQRWTRAK